MTFSAEELERYARHIVLREIGGPGQARLKAARVVLIGAGGLGSAALLYLAAAGVGTLVVVDDDRVSLSNLQRQVIYGTHDIGRPKVTSAAEVIERLNPHVRVEVAASRFEAEVCGGLLAGADAVLDGSDSFATRQAVNAAAVAACVPLVAAAMSQWEGQVSIWNPKAGGPCYECVFPEAPAPGLAPSCAEAGIVGALPGTLGAMMALETVKLLTGAGRPLLGRMLIYDALEAEVRIVRLSRRTDCRICSAGGR
jgi:molybdopterin/thiamine biosynthesis adenylyltransferase